MEKKINNQKIVRILQILNHMDYGGIEAVVMNYYRFIDREEVQFDFAVCEDSSLPQKEEIEVLGGQIYLLPPVSHLSQYISRLKQIILDNSYETVHCHMNTLSVFPLYAAWRAKVKVRICHNHTTAHRGEGKKTIAKYLLRPWCKWFATDYFACGRYAGQWMFGKKCMSKGRVYIMHNAIDVERFRYNPFERISARLKLNVADNFVIGHVGRFVYQKNHEFLIDVFAEVYKKRRNAVLLLVGEGELGQHIREKVKSMGLEEAVIFYGTSEDTSKLYQAMDVFVFPSFCEGLGLVAVEAQCAGVPVVVSDAIPNEAVLTSRCCTIPLTAGAGVWANTILNTDIREEIRYNAWRQIAEGNYSLQEKALQMQKFYRKKSVED